MFQGNLPDFHNMEHVAKIIDYLEQFDDKTWFRLQRKPKETVTVSGEAFKCQKQRSEIVLSQCSGRTSEILHVQIFLVSLGQEMFVSTTRVVTLNSQTNPA